MSDVYDRYYQEYRDDYDFDECEDDDYEEDEMCGIKGCTMSALDGCQECGLPLCHMHSETGCGFCHDCPTSNFKGYK